MTLLFNVYITDKPANESCLLKENRGNLKSFSNLDIVKYSLASLAKCYSWQNVMINIELDPKIYTESDDESLQDFVNAEFTNIPGGITYTNKRNTSQSDWKKSAHNIQSDFVLYLGNHDHIFIDSDTKYISQLLDYARKNCGKYATIACSHWPEAIRSAKTGYIHFNQTKSNEPNQNYKLHTNHVSFNNVCLDSLNIITKDLFYNWFLEGDWKDLEVLRTDGVVSLNSPSIQHVKDKLGLKLPIQEVLVPYRELFRHFDGYMHQNISHEVCPPISIPSGFFDSNIKIRYGYEDYKEGWVNLNSNLEFKAHDISGIDDKILLHDIPVFWKDRISKTDINKKTNEQNQMQHRLLAVLKMIYSDNRYNQHICDSLKESILGEYLKTYKQYKLTNEN